jgi:hypothetical protein
VAIDLLGIPVEVDPEQDTEKYQKAVGCHPWTRWESEMKARVFNTNMMKMIEDKAETARDAEGKVEVLLPNGL